MASTEEDKLLTSINNIKSSISEKDQLLWKYQASAKCYADERERLTEHSEELRKRTTQIETTISDLQPLVPILERSYEIQQMSMKISFESLSIHRSHKKQLEIEIKKRKDESDRIKKEYELEFQDIKQKLEKSNPHYQVVQEKRADLMKCQVRCKMLEAKIVQFRDIFERRKDIFYAEIISLARRWMAMKDFQEKEKKLIDLKRVEIEWMKKLTEIQDKLRKKKKDSHCRYEPTKLEISLKPNNINTSKLTPALQTNRLLPPPAKKQVLEEELTNKNTKAMEDLQSLMKQSIREPLSHNSLPLATPKSSLDPVSKVLVLEDKVLLAAPQVKPPKPVLNQQQRSQAIDVRLQRAVEKIAQKKNRKRSWYFQSSQRSNASSRPTSRNDLDASMEVDNKAEQDKLPSTHLTAALPTTQSNNLQDEEDTSHNILNITSQEESQMKFVSQDMLNNSSGNYLKNINKVMTNPNPTLKFNPQLVTNDYLTKNLPGVMTHNSIIKKPEPVPPVLSGNNFMINFQEPGLMADCIDSKNTFNLINSKNVNGKDQRDANLLQNNVSETGPQYDFGNITQFNNSINFEDDYNQPFLNSPPPSNIPPINQKCLMFGGMEESTGNNGPSGIGFFKF